MEKPFTGLRKEELQDFKLHSTSDSLGDVKNYDEQCYNSDSNHCEPITAFKTEA